MRSLQPLWSWITDSRCDPTPAIYYLGCRYQILFIQK
nr:MAG TPA: hypothetical protein [Caudoviricetes sp.]